MTKVPITNVRPQLIVVIGPDGWWTKCNILSSFLQMQYSKERRERGGLIKKFIHHKMGNPTEHEDRAAISCQESILYAPSRVCKDKVASSLSILYVSALNSTQVHTRMCVCGQLATAGMATMQNGNYADREGGCSFSHLAMWNGHDVSTNEIIRQES